MTARYINLHFTYLLTVDPAYSTGELLNTPQIERWTIFVPTTLIYSANSPAIPFRVILPRGTR